MKRATLDWPTLGLIAGTRGMLGAGIGLLLADRLTPEKRRAMGWTLLVVGVLSSGPLLAEVLHGSKSEKPNEDSQIGGRVGSRLAEEQRSGAGT